MTAQWFVTTVRRAVSGLLVVQVLGCSSAYEGESIAVVAPSPANFANVAETLDYSCGNLACHGTPHRNFVLYGSQGRRLDPKMIPCGAPTTSAEVQADYRSAVGLEPEVMAEVVESGGAQPERLTLVRKARGVENHKGGSVFRDSTDLDACVASCSKNAPCERSCYGDRCLVSWLGGKVDVPNCGNALPETRCNPVTQ